MYCCTKSAKFIHESERRGEMIHDNDVTGEDSIFFLFDSIAV